MFNSFFMGGFECSTHLLPEGTRLDLLAATQHDRFCAEDYLRLQRHGIFTVRSSIRWHLIEREPYHYDFSSVQGMLEAAQATGTQVIWDLCHYGYPDDLDPFLPDFIGRFTGLARAFATFLRAAGEEAPVIVPINEISFFSWAGGDEPHLNPYAQGRGFELKVQLVRAALAASAAFHEVLPCARMIHVDPLIHIVPNPERPDEAPHAEGYRVAQYQAWDMLAGRHWPGLGGDETQLDIIGVNYYPNNQWVYQGEGLEPADPRYRPLRLLLADVYERYACPILLSETGTEDEARPGWFRYICDEVRAAMAAGIPVVGICWYPIVNHPGWVNARHCHNGLYDYCDEGGERELYAPLAAELEQQRRLFERFLASRTEVSV